VDIRSKAVGFRPIVVEDGIPGAMHVMESSPLRAEA
jgi:hypothetical protein